jgi:8-oxo-dGTP pyrophosphatase MutT (NUDIX family)
MCSIPDLVSGLVDAKLRDAAVLVPVTDDGPDARVILTRRATALRKHSGQVAFPGGSVDPEDGSVEIAAMREAEEEIGLDRSFVEPVGRLPVYMTTTGFRITPVLAVVQAGLCAHGQPAEVDAVFETPLSFLMNPDNHRAKAASGKASNGIITSCPMASITSGVSPPGSSGQCMKGSTHERRANASVAHEDWFRRKRLAGSSRF